VIGLMMKTSSLLLIVRTYDLLVVTVVVSYAILLLQTRDAILKGAHPINLDYAVQFAGIQCQIQFGDHVDSKHKPGFLE
jgi:FERM central domain